MYLTLSAYMCLQYTFKDEEAKEKNESSFIASLEAMAPKLSRSSLIDCCVTTRLALLLSEKNYFLISKMEEIIVCSGHPTVRRRCSRGVVQELKEAQTHLKGNWK